VLIKAGERLSRRTIVGVEKNDGGQISGGTIVRKPCSKPRLPLPHMLSLALPLVVLQIHLLLRFVLLYYPFFSLLYIYVIK